MGWENEYDNEVISKREINNKEENAARTLNKSNV